MCRGSGHGSGGGDHGHGDRVCARDHGRGGRAGRGHVSDHGHVDDHGRVSGSGTLMCCWTNQSETRSASGSENEARWVFETF